MIFFDESVRLTLSTHGGMVLYLPETDTHTALVVWNNVGGTWGVGYFPNITYFNTLPEAIAAHLKPRQDGK